MMMSKRPVQKFKRWTKVYIKSPLPKMRNHFLQGRYAIVVGTYAQIYPFFDKYATDQYRVAILNEEENKVVNRISWYDESDLVFINNNKEENKELYMKYMYPEDE